MQSSEHDFFSLLFYRFFGGVTHSFTDSAEDRDKLLNFSNMYIGEYLAVHPLIMESISFCETVNGTSS